MTNFIKHSVKVFRDIILERKRQLKKWGIQDHKPYHWLAILTEEYLEAVRGILDNDSKENIREELIQVATVAIAFVEWMDRTEEQELKNKSKEFADYIEKKELFPFKKEIK